MSSHSYEDVKPLSERERQQLALPPNAPLRVLSFDIETMVPKDNSFPNPIRESVIQISSVVARRCCKPAVFFLHNGMGTQLTYPHLLDPSNGLPEDPFFRCVFTLNTCAAISGCTVFSFRDEVELLNEWRKFMISMDPDVVAGHNILRFDIPYLLLRAAQHGLEDFKVLGRLTGSYLGQFWQGVVTN